MFELKRNIHSSLHRTSHFYFFAACAYVGVLLSSITALRAQTPSPRQATKDSEEVRKLREAVRELQAEVANLKNEIRNCQPSAAAASRYSSRHIRIQPRDCGWSFYHGLVSANTVADAANGRSHHNDVPGLVAGRQGTDIVNSVV